MPFQSEFIDRVSNAPRIVGVRQARSSGPCGRLLQRAERRLVMPDTNTGLIVALLVVVFAFLSFFSGADFLIID
jgi:hypothetical protein